MTHLRNVIPCCDGEGIGEQAVSPTVIWRCHSDYIYQNYKGEDLWFSVSTSRNLSCSFIHTLVTCAWLRIVTLLVKATGWVQRIQRTGQINYSSPLLWKTAHRRKQLFRLGCKAKWKREVQDDVPSVLGRAENHLEGHPGQHWLPLRRGADSCTIGTRRRLRSVYLFIPFISWTTWMSYLV